jgi:general secretion pathway protein E
MSALRAVSAEQLEAVLAKCRFETPADGSLLHRLIECLSIDKESLADLLLLHHGVSILSHEQFSTARLIAFVGESIAQVQIAERLYLLCEDPWSTRAWRQHASSEGFSMALASGGQLRQLLDNTQTATRQEQPQSGDIVGFVDEGIKAAYEGGASDIHFECDRAGVAIKYRIDGVMTPGQRLNDPLRAEEVLSRIKVLAQLDITERRRPQDGRIHWERVPGTPVDLRVSIMPSIFGEDAVLRLLDKAQLRHGEHRISLEKLGFEPNLTSSIRSLTRRPHGMLLITGPTGSGKTTTVYAALSEVNDGLEKIVTIEDPVEYELPGVLQIPVNEQKGLTFATGLRSILRHDPDKILVGEIRDAETAEIAVQASLTGHLVLTTVHANSLFDVLGRFQHFGIDPFALSSALNGVVVQRLLRRLCVHCAHERPCAQTEHALFGKFELSAPLVISSSRGCERCRGTGYSGRFVVAEIHEVTDDLRDLIMRRVTISELRSALTASGTKGIQTEALSAVARRATSIEEVARVVGLA